MLKNNRIVLGITILSLLTFPRTNIVAFANECEKSNIELKQLNTHDNGLIINKGYDNIQRNIKSYKLIQEKVNERINKIEERHKLEEEKKNSYNIDFVLTYYSRHPSENGGYNATAYSTPLRTGIVASCYYPKGTKILLENGTEYVVEDTGAKSIFSSPNRLDVFVDTYDRSYVNSLGVTYIKGKIINE